MSMYAYIRAQRQKNEQIRQQESEDLARQTEMENMQMGIMRGEVGLQQQQMAASQAAAKSAAPMAKKYMEMWNTSLKSTQGMYNQAMSSVGEGWDAIKAMQSDKVDFSKLTKDLETEWENIKGKFGGLSDQAISMAGEEMTQRQQLGKQLTSLAQPDYEGAAGRAMADVAGQSEIGRQAEQRRMASLGIDPTSGRSRSAMNTMQSQEALAKAQAGTQARRGEKERVTGVTQSAMQLIDPSKTAGIATNIQAAKGQMLAQRTGLAEAQTRQASGIAGAIGSMAGAAGSIARGMGETVTAPLGEAAGVYSGMAMQGGYDPISGRSAMPTSKGGSSNKISNIMNYNKNYAAKYGF